MNLKHFLFFFCVPSLVIASSNISVILKHCVDYPECYESYIDQFSADYHKSLVKLLSGGLNQFLWEYVSQTKNLPNTNISSSCDTSLKHVWSSITSGQEWAFKSEYTLNVNK